ncbi:hypothetical protein PO878_05350 [Iamia majanohamensis]|uniref:Uncharacterized protein n=1 Tax=Iamia majanohamensis TaxID=467976 RepID=A0AAE9Y7H7_9ACTN|nr:hypothetical protein [Iamia majanohamensis]WCO68149.1 hypothetical protein PO878_05350 [Iamia majanohamensis]
MTPTTRPPLAPIAHPAAVEAATAPTVAAHLDRLGTRVAADAPLAAGPLAALVGLLAEAVADAGHRPVPSPGPDAPLVAILRTAGLLAARTAGTAVALPPVRAAHAEGLWVEAEGRPAPRTRTARPSSAPPRSVLVDVA